MRSPDQIGITWEENQLLMQQLREKAALENRRQHNIFEVGDKVVIKAEPFWPEDYIIQTVGQEHIGKWYMAAWKHATDAEIKAGKRLEVKSEN
ncbi:hypothetical protein [Acinetobacter johnsonii]|uniref:hypothetical protein n=1 Tax=Acinetobacter johnsonii TaxID=40214 RepID=UPI00244A87D8|nr:hypothetical protein [Acinetobacter johnsonii]MDH1408219.1 hypothetical protein [Acinetobacter johnsonii]